MSSKQAKRLIALIIATTSISSFAWPALTLSFNGKWVKHAGRFETFSIDISKLNGWDRCDFYAVKEQEPSSSSVACFAKSSVAVQLNCGKTSVMLYPPNDDGKWLNVQLKCE